MGWQDAEVVKGGTPDTRPAWMRAPQASAAPAPTAPDGGPHNPFLAQAKSEASDVGDLSDMAITKLLNLPHDAWQGLKDLGSRITGQGAINKTPGPAHVSPETTADLQPGPMGQKAIAGVSAADRALETASPTAHNVLHQTGDVLGDVGDIASIVDPALRAGGAIRTAANTAKAAAAAPATSANMADALTKVGYKALPRQSGGGKIATAASNVVGEPELAAQHTLQNQEVTNALARHEAKLPESQEITPANMQAARDAGPGAVYNAAHDSLPENLTADTTLQDRIKSIGTATSQLPKSPDVEAITTHMLAQPNMTRDELFANAQAARERASKFFASDAPESEAVGQAYKELADAYEDFIGRKLDDAKGAPVSSTDWQQARVDFAKSHAVQAATRGTSVDASALARVQRKDPSRLTGGLRLIAEQQNRYPLSTGFGPQTFAPGGQGAAGSVQGAIARHGTAPAIGAGVGLALGGPAGAGIGGAAGAAGSLAVNSILRRVLGGSPAKGAAAATAALKDPRFSSFFGEPKPQFENLSPGAPAPLSLADELGAGGRAAEPQGEISLADVLAHGVEHEPSAGLSLAEEPGVGGKPAEGVPFKQNAEHAAGDLSLAEDATQHPAVRDLMDELAGVMHQNKSEGRVVQSGRGRAQNALATSPGVPEGIMSRTANNASGESAASLEAINRSRIEQAEGKDRFLVDPDGKLWPIRGVEAADASAPKGSIIIQKGVGDKPYTVLDRGGLPKSHADGLLNRALGGGTGLSLGDMF